MPNYILQVRVRENGQFIWRDCHPSGVDTPYRFSTEERAQKIRRMCYPGESPDFIRVASSEESPNYE